jgi:hypothetical protein
MSRNRRIITLLFSSAIMAGAIIVGASLVRGAGEEPKAADPASLLLQRVEALERRVDILEKGTLPAIAPYSPVAPSPPGQNRVPESWRPYQFNGQTYYILPIDASGTTQGQSTNGSTPVPNR